MVDLRILQAPRLNWEDVDPRALRYLKTNVAGTPWVNQLALLVGVLTAHTRLDASTVRSRLYGLHVRWREVFAVYHLTTFEDWDPAEHLPRYMSDPDLDDTFETRQEFLQTYGAAVQYLQVYLRSLPAQTRTIYQQWELPALPMGLHDQLSRRAELVEAQRQRRKAETDAVAPHFARIRGEAQLRWNQLHRLRGKVQEVIALVQSGQAALPVVFSYEETHPSQRLHFLLWDRQSFVQAHADQYSKAAVWEARRQIRGFRPERNHFFLELVGTETPPNAGMPPNPDTLLWFGDILRYDLLSEGPLLGMQEEIQQKQGYLRSWGYESEQGRRPFSSAIAGLLAWPHEDGSANFLRLAQRRAKGHLLLVEPLFAAATFGLAALDFFTTTGARMSELLQVSLTPACLYTLVVEGTQRLLIRLVPKGSDKPADYMVGPETRRNFEKVAHLLQEHYRLKSEETLPLVEFCKHHGRSHKFPDSYPYLFQYGGQHLSSVAITACLRFLCHGLVFQTPEGRTVALKAHLLRHVFATHIHQVEQVPLDVVAVMLHQKNIRVTSYYAAPPWHQVLASASSLLDHFATHLGPLEDAFVRAPTELQRQYEEAKQRVGTLAKVPGGECTCHGLCPISFACTGCVFKVPDPARRDEIEEQEHWAMIRLEQVTRRRLGPEVVKMQALIQRCHTEKAEMSMIETYRKDEQYEPKLTLEQCT